MRYLRAERQDGAHRLGHQHRPRQGGRQVLLLQGLPPDGRRRLRRPGRRPASSPRRSRRSPRPISRGHPGEPAPAASCPFSQGLPTAGQWRNGFDIADMNGDGHLDIVHWAGAQGVRPAGHLPRRRQGELAAVERGQVSRACLTTTATPRWPTSTATATPDIALGMHLRGSWSLLGDGKGNFTEWSKGLDFAVPGRRGRRPGFSSRTLAVADWNRDGAPGHPGPGRGAAARPSRAATRARRPGRTESYGIVVYLNQGDGTWVRKDQGTSEQRALRRLDHGGRLQRRPSPGLRHRLQHPWGARPWSTTRPGGRRLERHGRSTLVRPQSYVPLGRPPTTSTATAWTTWRWAT